MTLDLFHAMETLFAGGVLHRQVTGRSTASTPPPDPAEWRRDGMRDGMLAGMIDDEQLLELPAPGQVVWARTLGMETTVRCRIEGLETTVRFEYSRTTDLTGRRRVHLVREHDRGDTLGWYPELGALRRCDLPDDER